MTRPSRIAVLLFALAAVPSAASLEAVFAKLYNFDFPAAHRELDAYIPANPQDPLGYAVRASAYLFSELDRLQILESQYFEDDKKVVDKKKLTPDPRTRDLFFQALGKAREIAQARLASQPKDTNALFTMAIAAGLETDYASLVDRRHMASLIPMHDSQDWANRLLQADPNFADAYLTSGISEYLLGSLPFFVRWFVHFDGVEGSKQLGVVNLEKAAAHGRYLGPFARILLSIIYLRAKQPARTEELLAELSREYPGNPLFRKELDNVRARLRRAR